MTTIFISAGEVSGDRYGALLAQALKEINPNLTIIGMGSAYMRDAGVSIVEDISSMSSVGVYEALIYLPKLFRALKNVKKIIKKEKPDHFIAIDCQGFHMQILKHVKKLNITSSYFIAPQEWQWGTEKGAQDINKLCSHILTIFNDEQAYYNTLNIPTTFVGHPILDLVKSTQSKNDFYADINCPLDKPILALFPGSRSQEINRIAPILIESAKQCLKHDPSLMIIVSLSNERYRKPLSSLLKKHGLDNAILYDNNSHNLITHAHLSLTTSGTVTLEHALLETPCVVAYRFHPLTYYLGLLLFPKLRNQFMSLPNIFLKEKILPEFLQKEATPTAISNEAILLLKNKNLYDTLLKKLSPLKTMMGEKGAINKAAKQIDLYVKSQERK